MATYKVVRFYRDNEDLNRTVVTRGLTLEQARAHCNDPETSSSTATRGCGPHQAVRALVRRVRAGGLR